MALGGMITGPPEVTGMEAMPPSHGHGGVFVREVRRNRLNQGCSDWQQVSCSQQGLCMQPVVRSKVLANVRKAMRARDMIAS